MIILVIDSIFTNILIEESNKICTNDPFKNNDVVHGLEKSEFKDLLSLVTKKPYFIFNKILYKQIDQVAMGSPLGSSLANVFLPYHERDWLHSYSLE